MTSSFAFGGDPHEEQFIMENEIRIGVNPITKTEVILNPPVRINSYEELAEFSEVWNKLCEYCWELAKVDLREVSICLGY